jgi:spoIIIJ-associated protein
MTEQDDVRKFTGKTVQEAVEAAAAALGIDEDALDYEVVRTPERSLFGLVRTGEAAIRVKVPMEGPDQADSAAWPGLVEGEAEQVSEMEAEEIGVEEAEEEPERAPRDPRLKHNPPGLQDAAEEVITTLLDYLGVLAAVEVVDSGGTIDPETGEAVPLQLNVVGDDLGILIGRRGETLRDFQFISRLIISRKLGVWPNMVVDVEGYKERRVETLHALAKRMADQVRETGRPFSLEPMPPNERRAVHMALRDDPDVYTESSGEEPRRKVRIYPKD